MEIDYERLELIVGRDIHESCRDQFDLQEICRNARLVNGKIIVQSAVFRFTYDAETYQQIPGENSGGG